VSGEKAAAGRRAAVPLLVGLLLGFIGGYFAAGGGRPAPPAAAPPASGASADRIAQLRDALERDRENPRLWTELGNAYYDEEDWVRAIEAYEKARRKAPKDPNLLSDLGAAYRNAGQLQRAVHFFERARESGPDHWQSLLNLTLMHAFDLRDAAAAQRHYDELKRRYPEIPQVDRIQQKISELRAGA
jgi:tetratricopeptide (TPR) repeat protein